MNRSRPLRNSLNLSTLWILSSPVLQETNQELGIKVWAVVLTTERSLKKDKRRPLLLRAALDSPVSTGRGKQTSGAPTRSLCLEKLSDLIGWELHHPSRSGSLCLLASASLTEPIGALFCLPVCFACEQTARFRQNESTRKLSASAVP